MKDSHLIIALGFIIGIIVYAYQQNQKKKQARDLANKLNAYANNVEQKNKRLHNQNTYLRNQLSK